MSKQKYMNLQEFVDKGFLQEANRRFFHPLGLALEIKTNDDGKVTNLSGIWDYREDSEGICFNDLSTETAIKKSIQVDNELEKHREAREKMFGDIIQPIERN